jgi:beta-phosphoglucomutase
LEWTGEKMDNKKAFIFDLDGVIVFTDKYHYLAWKELADKLGIYFDETINNRLRGVSRMESLEIILERSDKEYSETQKVQFAAEKNELYRKLLGQMTPADVSDSVRNTLAKLREERHKIAIGSSSKNAKFILEQVALTDAFDAISDGLNITRSKPDPEVFLKAADFLGEAYDNCIVVEDAYAGIDAAKAAGMMAVGIGDAALYEKTDVAISDFEELLSLKSNLSA